MYTFQYTCILYSLTPLSVVYILRYVLSVFVYDCMLLFRLPKQDTLDKHDGVWS